MPVPARAMTFTPVDRIFSRMGAGDRIIQGESTFAVEMRELSTALRGATRHSLLLIDELGRGTAVREGMRHNVRTGTRYLNVCTRRPDYRRTDYALHDRRVATATAAYDLCYALPFDCRQNDTWADGCAVHGGNAHGERR